MTKVCHKPSHEPYYLPFNSIHPLHMKKNIPFAMFLRAIRYCSTFDLFIQERESLRMTLLLNKYPPQLIENQFKAVLDKFRFLELFNAHNYNSLRTEIVSTTRNEQPAIEHDKTLFVHFTYCPNMRLFPTRFHELWRKHFAESPINGIQPILGKISLDNLQSVMIHHSE